MRSVHYSVLKEEVFEFLSPKVKNGLLIDGTLGEGGHAELFLQRMDSARVIGIDADKEILSRARERCMPFADRIRYFNMWFNTFFSQYPLGDERPDAILFDLGISSFHYKQAGRGFTFEKDEPLDMRLDDTLEISASDIVNTYPEKELADIIFEFGEERYSRRIARFIAEFRKKNTIETTGQLKDIIWKAVPQQYRHGRIHPATRTFQALRILVNGELARLKITLQDALNVLKVGGRMGVISFHSLEDRIVKEFFREKNKSCTCPPEWPMCKCGGERIVTILTKKPVPPKEQEISINPPSRSAKLRVIEKLREEESVE